METGKWSRRHGWACPPHPLQIAAWLLLAYLTVLQFAIIAPVFRSLVTRVCLYVVMTVVIGFVVVVKALVTGVDPGDDNVRVKLRRRPQPAFDRTSHAHVIDHDYYCNICREIVHPSSKHCRQCNKCTLDFDHHCKWLNNCVGARNYKWFLIFVGGVVLSTACMALQCLALLVCFFVEKDSLLLEEEESLVGVLGERAWLGLLGSTLLITAIISGLTAHLLCFHISLVKRGLTTYNFIMDKRETAAVASHTGASHRGWLGKAKSSRNPALPSAKVEAKTESKVPTLPPIATRTQAPINSVSSAVPFKQPSNGISATEAHIEMQSVPHVVKLPPILAGNRPTTTKKLFEPAFESVLGEEGELTLPSILVTQSDSDTLLGSSTSSFRALPPGPALRFREPAKAVPDTGARRRSLAPSPPLHSVVAGRAVPPLSPTSPFHSVIASLPSVVPPPRAPDSPNSLIDVAL